MGSKKRHLIYKRKNGKQTKHNGKQVYHNSGQILEDIINKRLNHYKYYHTKNNTRVFYAVAENLKYTAANSITYEIDNIVVRSYHGKKTVLLFEDKMGNHRTKAYTQLGRHVEHIKLEFDVDKIMCFYVHNYNRRKKSYDVEHVKTLDYRLER